MKRVFKIDIETCEHCGGAVKVIASIEDPAVMGQVLGIVYRAIASHLLIAAGWPAGQRAGCPAYFMARLAALVPTPRVNLTRYHGVFAPNHRLRVQITPARRGQRKSETTDEPVPARHVSMTWAQRLKRVFKIDILTCTHCGGAVKVIASIEAPIVIKQILEHLERRAAPANPAFRPFARAPPAMASSGLKEPG